MSDDAGRMDLPDRPQADGTYRVLCSRCGKSVSSALSAPVVVRAWVECPECLGAEAKGYAKAHVRLARLDRALARDPGALAHAVRLLRWWAADESDDPDVLERIRQSHEVARSLVRIDAAYRGRGER